MSKLKIFLIAIFSSILFVITLPPFNFSLAAWFVLAPLLYIIFKNGSHNLNTILCVYSLTGAISYFFGCSWIMCYKKSVFFIVWPLCAISFPIFGISIYILCKRVKNIFLQALLIPSVWIVLVKLYSLTFIGSQGMELFFAYNQSNIYLIQIASVFGTMGLSFLMILCNTLITMTIIHRDKKGRVLLLILSICFMAIFIFGYIRVKMSDKQIKDKKTIKIALVQPGSSGEPGFENVIPTADDFPLLLCVQKRITFPSFVYLNKKAETLDPNLIIWPQYHLPVDFIHISQVASKIVRKFYYDFSTPILVGTFIYQDSKISNISLLLDEKGGVAGFRPSVIKTPFRNINQSFAKKFKILELPIEKGGDIFRIGTLICFEDIAGDNALELIRQGAEFLVTQTNYEFFQKTLLPLIHLRRNIFIAIETRRWVVCAATTGISAIISPSGRVIGKIDIKKRNILFAEIFANAKETFYARHENLIYYFSAFVLITSFLSCSHFAGRHRSQ